MNDYLATWKKIFDYSGRSTRKEYWMFVLYNLIAVVPAFVVGALIYALGIPTLDFIYSFFLWFIVLPAMMLCLLALLVRRIHDVDKSGLFLLLALVPFVGLFVIFAFTLLETKPGTNQWGTANNDSAVEGISIPQL